MSNALIFSPGFDGHRQVYVFVLAHVLKELGFNIYIAGNTKQIITNSFYIDNLKKSTEIKIIDTSKYAEGGYKITTRQFIELQNAYEIDLTVFAEADHHISLFISQIFGTKNRFRGRIVGIFMRPFYYYRKTGILDRLRFLKHFPSLWKHDQQLFFDFFLNRFSLLHEALCIDENFVANHQYLKWLPDVFQQYAELILKDKKAEQRIWIEKLSQFKEKNKGRFLFFYFGTAQPRRGYDILLKLAEENEGSFIHCGLRDNNANFPIDINQIRSSLSNDGRLFETDEYIADPLCIEYFFKSVSHLILPYRNYFGSSGVMLQALDYGIPILSPENGIIGHRIKKYQLGITYDDKYISSLKTQFDSFKNLNQKIFENEIKLYMNFQTTDQLKKVLINSFTGSYESVKYPFLQ